MAFDKNVFNDGESAYEVPYWRKVIENVSANVNTFNYQDEFIKRQTIQENEVGIKHPKNNSFIKIKDDGTIEAFVSNGSGLRIRPDETLQLFGDVQVIGNSFQGITKKNESSFNQEQLSGGYPSVVEKGHTQALRDLQEELGGS